MERASSSSSSPSNSPRKGDVLLSYSDEDVGNNFASHLKAALNRKGIDTVRREDEAIGRDLKCSVIIFSPNYASSASRLDQVATILQWKNMLGHKLIPVFYEVAPSDVRKQRGSFGEAFSEHGQDSKAPGWRRALADVANLSGKHFDNGDEAKFVEEIVEEVSSKLRTVSSCSPFSGLERVGLTGLISSLSTWLTRVHYIRVAFFFFNVLPIMTPPYDA